MSEREELRLSLLTKYTKILESEDNCDVEPWTCKVCGWGPARRLFAVIEHGLAHVRKNELEPVRQEVE